MNINYNNIPVLPRSCAPLSPGSIPGPRCFTCIWFPVRTCFRRFFSGFSGFPPASKTVLLFLLHLNLCFLNYSASADWQLAWHCALSHNAYFFFCMFTRTLVVTLGFEYYYSTGPAERGGCGGPSPPPPHFFADWWLISKKCEGWRRLGLYA